MEAGSVKTGILRYSGRAGPASCAYALEYRPLDAQRPYWLVITRIGDTGEWMDKTLQRIVNALLAGELAGVSPTELLVVHYRPQESEQRVSMQVVDFLSAGRVPGSGDVVISNWEVDNASFEPASWETYVQVLDMLDRGGLF